MGGARAFQSRSAVARTAPLYATAQFEILPAEPEYPHAVFIVRLEPEHLASIQGLGARYWAGDQWGGDPTHVARAPVLDMAWPADAPLALSFVAEWSGILYAPSYGQYPWGWKRLDA